MRVIFDKYGKIVGTPTTDDYWGQGDNLTIFLEAQFLDDNEEPIVFSVNQILEVVVERPDGQISPALFCSIYVFITFCSSNSVILLHFLHLYITALLLIFILCW